MPETTKPWWHSKTVWFNVGTAALEIVNMLSGAGVIPAGVGTLVVNGVNIVLRVFTTKPLSMTQQETPLIILKNEPT